MDYPVDFPPESRAAVEAEKLRAGRDFDQAQANPQPDRGSRRYLDVELQKYILRQFSAFVREACKLGHEGVWDLDRIEKSAMEFLRLATIDARYGKGSGVIDRDWTDNYGGGIESGTMREFRRSEEHRQFEDALLEVADALVVRAKGNTLSGGGETPDEGMDRRKMVDEFLARCNRESGSFRVTRTHLSLVAGHKHVRQFQYWQQKSANATEKDHRTFCRILSMPPADFIILAKKESVSRRKSSKLRPGKIHADTVKSEIGP